MFLLCFNEVISIFVVVVGVQPRALMRNCFRLEMEMWLDLVPFRWFQAEKISRDSLIEVSSF